MYIATCIHDMNGKRKKKQLKSACDGPGGYVGKQHNI